MPSPTLVAEHDPKAVVTSILWHAVEKAGDKLKDQKRRDVLPAGGRIPVELRIEGRIDNARVAAAMSGHLQIAHDGTFSSKDKPDPATALAQMLQHVPKTRRKQALQTVGADLHRRAACPAEDLAACQLILDEATRSTTKPKAGTVSFEFAD